MRHALAALGWSAVVALGGGCESAPDAAPAAEAAFAEATVESWDALLITPSLGPVVDEPDLSQVEKPEEFKREPGVVYRTRVVYVELTLVSAGQTIAHPRVRLLGLETGAVTFGNLPPPLRARPLSSAGFDRGRPECGIWVRVQCMDLPRSFILVAVEIEQVRDGRPAYKGRTQREIRNCETYTIFNKEVR